VQRTLDLEFVGVEVALRQIRLLVGAYIGQGENVIADTIETYQLAGYRDLLHAAFGYFIELGNDSETCLHAATSRL
jgi:hypothetical protein